MLERKEICIPFYEKIWGNTFNAIQSLIDSGERKLSRSLNFIEQTENQLDNLSSLEEEIATKLEVPRDDRNVPLFKLVASAGKYVFVPRDYVDNTITVAVINRIAEDTDFVVELGSGWGRNLFRIYLHNPFAHLKYVACEPTESGRRATKILADLESSMPVTTMHFDFDDPDLSFLTGSPNVLFFTRHAIEQCIHFNSRVFDLMMEKTGKCVCVHMEPIGWQRHSQAEMVKRMIEQDKRSVENFAVEDKDFLQNSATWALNRRYNTDLPDIIETYRKSGYFTVEALIYDIFGGNPFNPSTLVVWRKNGS